VIGPEQLADFVPFRRLTPSQREAVWECASTVEYAAGSQLFEEGKDAVGCWLIRIGQVALSTKVPGRGQVVVQTLGPGDVLGLSWLVPPHCWHFTATAPGPLDALELDTARLRALADGEPDLGYPLALGMFEVMLARLQSSRARLLDLYGNPRER
jgi:CRP/FNR family cyclic AMP-dependent transcriptional regulator